MDKEPLQKYIGITKNEIGLKKSLRFHENRCRTFFLNETQDDNPSNKGEKVCNTILLCKTSTKNFLTASGLKTLEDTLLERKTHGTVLFNTDRSYNNFSSSQSLAFNFFSSLK